MRTIRFIPAVAAIAASVLVFAVPAVAQQVEFHGAWVDANAIPSVPEVPTVVNPPGNSPDPNWGTSLWAVYNAGPCDVALRSGTMDLVNCAYVRSTSASPVYLGFPVHLPTGAVVQYARIYFNQTVIGETISAGFWKTDAYGVQTFIQGMSPTATTAGNTYQQWGPFSEVIDNAPSSGYTYSFLAYTSGATKIYKMMVYYKLQVSPAPGTATFGDVPTGHWAFQFVEALADSGITAGCGGGNFCPNNPLTRAEMAVYLSAALGLSNEF